MDQPAPPYGPQYGHGYAFPHPPPPDPPELPATVSRWPAWPWWYGPLAMGIGFVGTLIAAAVIVAVATAAGAQNAEDSPGFVQGATVVQDLIFVSVAILLAARVVRPRAWHFGLRRAPFWRTVGWAALGFVAYWLFAIGYGALVSPESEQETLEDLGTNQGTLWVVGAALLVIAVAPVAEEIFFRGFFYRALRTRLPVALAALANGTVFGGIHIGSTPAEILPVLMALGVVFCLVYEKTGTLFAPIGLHTVNNFIAFGASTDEWVVAGAVAIAVLAGCTIAARLLPVTAKPAPA